MIRAILLCSIAVACLLVPIWVSAAVLVAYLAYYRSFEVCALAICLDWYLQPEWPVLTLFTCGVMALLPFLRTRLMLYNGY